MAEKRPILAYRERKRRRNWTAVLAQAALGLISGCVLVLAIWAMVYFLR